MTFPRITDSHCHLDFPDFDEDRGEVIARAVASGVHRMVTICTKLHQEPQVRAIVEAHDPVFYAAGLHPMSVGKAAAVTVDQLVALARHPKFVGIGETGLDYHYTAARAADDDMARILTEGFRERPYACVMHCFSSSAELARAALDCGFYLSMSGIAAFPKSADLREIFAAAPLDRILLETDSPYLAPPPHRGRRNEPGYTRHTAEVGAKAFGLTLEEFAAATEANFDRLFAKAAAWRAPT